MRLTAQLIDVILEHFVVRFLRLAYRFDVAGTQAEVHLITFADFECICVNLQDNSFLIIFLVASLLIQLRQNSLPSRCMRARDVNMKQHR